MLCYVGIPNMGFAFIGYRGATARSSNSCAIFR